MCKHNRWEDITPDTNSWESLETRNKKRKAENQELENEYERQSLREGEVLSAGEYIVFPLGIGLSNLLPFGIGKVLSHEQNEIIKFQWLGNADQKEKGKFLPAWSNKDGRHYYKKTPEHHANKPYTGGDTECEIRTSDVILTSRTQQIIGEDGKIPKHTLEMIYSHKDVFKSLKRSK